MIVLYALAGIHELVKLVDGLRRDRFQLADLAADWLTEGATTRNRDRVAELEALAATRACGICGCPVVPGHEERHRLWHASSAQNIRVGGIRLPRRALGKPAAPRTAVAGERTTHQEDR